MLLAGRCGRSAWAGQGTEHHVGALALGGQYDHQGGRVVAGQHLMQAGSGIFPGRAHARAILG